jgi:hypothetical protein
VDPQVISVATAVVSAAVAALGLLLSSYRREDRKDNPRSRWFFLGIGAAIVALATAGVVATFVLGSDDQTPPAAATATTAQVTEAQYKGQVSAICLDSREEHRRLDELQAIKTLLGATIKVEEDEANRIKQLQPPASLRNLHDEIVFVMERRVRLMERTYQRLDQLSDQSWSPSC